MTSTFEERLGHAYWHTQELSPDGFVLLDCIRSEDGRVSDFRYDYVNPSGAAIVNREPVDPIGKRMLNVFPFVEHNGIFSGYVSVAETGTAWERELLYDRDGISVGFRIVAVRVGDKVALTFSDITERVLAEQQRDAAIARTERLLARTTDLAAAASEVEIADAVVKRVGLSLGAKHVSV